MKKLLLTFLCLGMCMHSLWAQSVLTGAEAAQRIPGTGILHFNKGNEVPSFIVMAAGQEIPLAQALPWIQKQLQLGEDCSLQLLRTETDPSGLMHIRYIELLHGNPVEGTMYVLHVKNGMVTTMNGFLIREPAGIPATAVLPESGALSMALNYIHADLYRWQNPGEEAQLKRVLHNEQASWYPQGILLFAPVQGNYTAAVYRLAYRFDIYAERPLSRKYVFVDAVTGEIINTQDRIEDANVPATANTQYCGVRPIMTDSNNGSYRLEETGRGLGTAIQTYNMLTGTSYANAVDFTNATTTWNNVNAQLDQYATDAHYGAEKTYDFYDSVMNRNSIDNAGMTMLLYVHYDVNYVNAFWDGTEMNFGDGGGGYTPLTSVEITGHEISHGVTQYCSGLNGGAGAQEPGALNEGMSDCMGNAIRHYATPSAPMDWLIGDQIGGTPFRDMQNPNTYGCPDTYMGTNWDPNQEVHTNSTVFSHCFYLLSVGGSGTNDIGSVYNVSAIGLDAVSQIWYKANLDYFTPTTQYSDARTYTIQAAIDLYGACSNEVIQVTNAWYAVGVGPAFSIGVTAAFTASPTFSCNLSAPIQFQNASTNAGTFTWHFGDGSSSNQTNPVHIYTQNGNYSVTLLADGGACGNDSVTVTNAVTINAPVGPVTTNDTACSAQSFNLNATGSGVLEWYDAPTGGNLVYTGNSYTTPVLGSTTTYYVESHIQQSPQTVGPPDNTFGGNQGGNYNTERYEIFDALSDFTLISVRVYSTGAANRTFELQDNTGAILWDTIINVPNAPNGTAGAVVTLNKFIPQGSGYMLGCLANSNLWRTSAGANYPYTLAGVCSITGNTAGDPARLYFVYDWQVRPGDCISSRSPVTAQIGGIHPVVSPSGNISLCSGQSVQLTAVGNGPYLWNTTATTQSIQVNAAGNYFISVYDSLCSVTFNSDTVHVSVSPMPLAGFNSQIIGGTIHLTDGSVNASSWTWYFGDGSSDTSRNPVHTYTNNGNYEVMLVACNGNCCDTSILQVSVTTVGITEAGSAGALQLFPNPTSGMLQIGSYQPSAGDVFTLSDLFGRKVLETALQGKNSVDLSGLPGGVYIARLQSSGKILTGRIVKQ